MGHIRNLPKSKLGVDVENGFMPTYVTIRGKAPLLKELKTAVNNADHVLLASDPDREGEAIAWHLKEYLQIPDGPCRVEFNEITKKAVLNGVNHPRSLDMQRVDAQQARRILDRLVGYKLSPLLWKKVEKGLSAGRVQSVAVRLICDREDEIKDFKEEEYWSLLALLDSGQGELEAKLTKIKQKKAAIANKEQMDGILADLKGQSYVVREVTKKKKQRNPVPPFTTSSLQQEASRKLGMSAKRTMQIAQQLYEGIPVGEEGTVGLISYMRTDSVHISQEAQNAARDFIAEKFGKPYVPEKPRFYSSKAGAQNAHEAIRPSAVTRTPIEMKAFLSLPQYKLYKLIWERFVASQMSSAIVDVTSIDIAAGDYLFRATGQTITFPGYMQVYREGRDDNSDAEEEGILPEVEKNQVLDLRKLDPKQHFTQPPPRYTEAMLVKAMEELGIGRPSTYAPIIDTILTREYVEKKEKQFAPTELGVIVTNLLKEFFPAIVDVKFTADMEKELDAVEEGKMHWQELLKGFYPPFEEKLDYAQEAMGKVEITPEESGEVCEKCGRPMVYKKGRFGRFLACSGFPECKNTKSIVKEVGVACMACGGKIQERKSRTGKLFYGCTNYPACQYMTWDKPIEELCPLCGTQMTEKTFRGGKKVKLCPNKECPSNLEKEEKKKAAMEKKAAKEKGNKQEKKTTSKKISQTTKSSNKKSIAEKKPAKKTVAKKNSSARTTKEKKDTTRKSSKKNEENKA